ncbi:hypothetical protein [Sulfuriflexus mobilis]|uniref:hypothetical protein n=1 Tax=Sulfuriflexus mobilis TaxID=1811807 RepID=UPI000F838A6A|nr:hypothetical protein [Sulfuriflexus mobilis]
MHKEEKIVITFMTGPEDGRSVTVKCKTVSIGKYQSNDVVIDYDPIIGERCIELIRHADRWEFLDKSGNTDAYMDVVCINEGGLFSREIQVEIGHTLLNIRIES